MTELINKRAMMPMNSFCFQAANKLSLGVLRSIT